MATSWVVVALKVTNRSSTDVKRDLFGAGTVGSQGKRYASRLVAGLGKLLMGVVSGVRQGNLYCTVLDDAGTRSTGNIACTQANAAGNFVRFTFGGVAITLTEGVDFVRGASDTTCAANLAAAINAHVILGPLMTALGAVGNCGLTSKIPGAIPQDQAITTDDATAFALTQLTGGTEGAAQFYLQHWDANKTA
jgi:hypothetical protein